MHSGALALWCNTRALASAHVAAALRLLSHEERARCDRFGFAEDRRDYVAAHALLRIALGARTNTAPDRVRFGTTALGKPFVIPASAELPAPSFSLAHSRGFVACVISAGDAVGIDVEPVPHDIHEIDVARWVFSDDEASALERCAGDELAARFCELWTLKEAFAKASGIGVTEPMRLPSVDIERGYVRVRGPRDWSFVQADLEGTHKLAIARNRRGRVPLGFVNSSRLLTLGRLECDRLQ
jgi:4'-phosphopantetheinyl transferase